MTRLTTLLMFEGQADEAMALYTSLFADGAIEHVERYGPDEPGAEGSVRRATFRLAGQRLACIDSPVEHAFTFTPSTTLVVACDGEAEQERLFAALSEGGDVLMPLREYPGGQRFGWLTDRFGVAWQLTL